MAVRKKVSRVSKPSKKDMVASWAQKVRGVIECVPKASLSDLSAKDVIKLLMEKEPGLELSHSKRVTVSSVLSQFKRNPKPKIKVRRAKITRRRGIATLNEPWEMALWMLNMCNNDFEVAQKNFREAKKCLTKIKKIRVRSSILRNAS